MAHRPRSRHTEHPVALGSFGSWVRLLCRLPRIGLRFIPRALFVTCTTFSMIPLSLWERIRYGKAVRQTTIHPEPVFIVGHWRSGTTHLHNLLCQDPGVGYLSTFQAMVPGACLCGERTIKPFLARQAAKRYPTRLIDNIPLSFDAPQEDEFALASLCPYSFLHGFAFPQQAGRFFQRYVLFEGISARARARWCAVYLALLRKVSFRNPGSRLVLKNCAHSGRLKTVLALFPNARFIHIHRDPYEVYLSTVHMHNTVLSRAQLQQVSPEQMKETVLQFYRKLMQRLLKDQYVVPARQWIDVRFTDLETDPLGVLASIYGKLELPGFTAALPSFEQYIRSVKTYRKNDYALSLQDIATVNEHWAFAFDAWGYKRRSSASGSQQENASADAETLPEQPS